VVVLLREGFNSGTAERLADLISYEPIPSKPSRAGEVGEGSCARHGASLMGRRGPKMDPARTRALEEGRSNRESACAAT
jgi:hypothetical protein